MAFPSSIEAAEYFLVAYNDLATTASQIVGISDTTVYAASTTNFPSSGWITIEDEIRSYTGKTSGSFTGCTPGADNTTAAEHASGKAISLTIPAVAWNRIVTEIRAIETALGVSLANVVEMTGDETIAGVKTFSSDPVFSTGGVVTQINTATLTNKRIDPRVNTITSSATPTPVGDTTDIFTITALAVDPTFAAPSGTPVNGQKLIIRIKDDGTGRTLAWNAIYRSVAATLPTSTTASKTSYVGFIYNSDDSKWDCVAVGEEA